MKKSSLLLGRCGREAAKTKIYHEKGLTEYTGLYCSVCFLLGIRTAGRVNVRMAFRIKYTRPAVVFKFPASVSIE